MRYRSALKPLKRFTTVGSLLEGHYLDNSIQEVGRQKTIYDYSHLDAGTITIAYSYDQSQLGQVNLVEQFGSNEGPTPGGLQPHPRELVVKRILTIITEIIV